MSQTTPTAQISYTRQRRWARRTSQTEKNRRNIGAPQARQSHEKQETDQHRSGTLNYQTFEAHRRHQTCFSNAMQQTFQRLVHATSQTIQEAFIKKIYKSKVAFHPAEPVEPWPWAALCMQLQDAACHLHPPSDQLPSPPTFPLSWQCGGQANV